MPNECLCFVTLHGGEENYTLGELGCYVRERRMEGERVVENPPQGSESNWAKHLPFQKPPETSNNVEICK